MVKTVALLCILSTHILVNAQVDTLKCKEYFTYYDTLLGENLIVIWETPPVLKKCFQKDVDMLKEIVRKQTNCKYILIDMIIDSEGLPICFRFMQEIEPAIKTKLTDKLKSVRFKPALIRDKGVMSIYVLKI
jgi:hypothetical protein